ncbi:reverse transcriptase family protein [Halobacteriovorax sp. DPLXC-1]|uniref:reverse transcriptase family protein n=1 Tax=Halobacteriovorax sp. DPLXC-1 TaxID=3110771 RepID=UPI002FF3C6C0
MSDSSYIVRDQIVNGKPREIQEPNKRLKPIHNKVKKLLAQVLTPSYLYSSKRFCSYKDNATSHNANDNCLTVDIFSFYQNTQQCYLKSSLIHFFKMSGDVADVLANILCYNGHIPTGSPSSQIAAYWAYKHTFDKINSLSVARNITFSLYVDDMTFSSSEKIDDDFYRKVSGLLKTVGLSIKNTKTKAFGKYEDKHITGIVLPSGSNIPRVANCKRKSLFEQLNSDVLFLKDMRSIAGRVNQINYVENDLFCPNLKSKVKKHLKRTELFTLLFFIMCRKNPLLTINSFDLWFKNYLK